MVEYEAVPSAEADPTEYFLESEQKPQLLVIGVCHGRKSNF